MALLAGRPRAGSCDPADMPAEWDRGERVGDVVEIATVGQSQPVGQPAVVMAPQYVIAAVAVEVAGPDNLPGNRHAGMHIGRVIDEAAARRSHPVG